MKHVEYSVSETSIVKVSTDLTVEKFDRVIDFGEILEAVKIDYEVYFEFEDVCPDVEVNEIHCSDYIAESDLHVSTRDGFYELIPDKRVLSENIEYLRKESKLAKHVAFQRTAMLRRNLLRSAYECVAGFEQPHLVYCEFNGCFESFSYFKYSEENSKEVALSVANQLIEIGFIIENLPQPVSKREQLQERLHYNLVSDCVFDRSEYRLDFFSTNFGKFERRIAKFTK